MSLKKSSNFIGKTVLVTGAAGSIGSALCRRIIAYQPERLLLLDQDETGLFDIYEELKDKIPCDYIIASIRERENLISLFYEFKPQMVIHAAAYKHVVLMERWPEEAEKTNIFGLQNVIDASLLSDVEKFVFISSDKAVHPHSVMGKTKERGEKICLTANGKTKFTVVRFGNVMPSRGSVVPIFQKQIAEGKNLTVTDKKMRRYFMGIYDAADLILKALFLGNGGEIFILDMGQPMFIKDLAQLMIKLSGKDLSIQYTAAQKGEKFSEQLMTKEEKKRMRKVGHFYVI